MGRGSGGAVCQRRRPLMLAASACTAAARVQAEGEVPIIGVLRSPFATQHDLAIEAIRAAFNTLGYTEGRNIEIEQRFASRHVDRLPGLAAEPVGKALDVKLPEAVLLRADEVIR
jgi:hypothetical protein